MIQKSLEYIEWHSEVFLFHESFVKLSKEMFIDYNVDWYQNTSCILSYLKSWCWRRGCISQGTQSSIPQRGFSSCVARELELYGILKLTLGFNNIEAHLSGGF